MFRPTMSVPSPTLGLPIGDDGFARVARVAWLELTPVLG
jgi:hypothetical protein